MTSPCDTDLFCPTCLRPGNRAWRKAAHGTEWPDCPRGLEIGSTGLGDTIARITTALGIPPCRGCDERQDALNRLVPYTQE